MEGEEPGTAEIHRRGSGRGLLEADLEEDEEEGLGGGFETPPLQHSLPWTSRSRINSYMVTTHSPDKFGNRCYTTGDSRDGFSSLNFRVLPLRPDILDTYP